MTHRRLHTLIVTGIFPPDIGGPATYVPRVAEALTKAGHLITVITLSDHLGQNDNQFPFKVIRIRRGTFKPWQWLYTILHLIRSAKGMDVIFVNGLAMEAVLANLVSKKPLVLKIVGDLAWERASNWSWVKDDFETFQKTSYGVKVRLFKALRNWWTRRADTVIVPSHYLGKWVANWGVGEEKLTVIYNALESPNGFQPAEVPLETSANLVTVGRLVAWKHIDRLIDATGQFDDVGLVIIGDGPERKHLEEITRKLDLESRIHFAGTKSPQETMALMAACDLFVLNSTYEGLPHVVLEAMGLGLPVVATAAGGTPEVVTHGFNGLLIAPLDDQALRGALSKLLFDTGERQRLAIGGRETLDRFTIGKMVEEAEAVLQMAAKVGLS
jgi:glycosyltransferase involved in cell wall biosynthesis